MYFKSKKGRGHNFFNVIAIHHSKIRYGQSNSSDAITWNKLFMTSPHNTFLFNQINLSKTRLIYQITILLALFHSSDGFDCPDYGTFRNPDDCTRYWVCDQTGIFDMPCGVSRLSDRCARWQLSIAYQTWI